MRSATSTAAIVCAVILEGALCRAAPVDVSERWGQLLRVRPRWEISYARGFPRAELGRLRRDQAQTVAFCTSPALGIEASAYSRWSRPRGHARETVTATGRCESTSSFRRWSRTRSIRGRHVRGTRCGQRCTADDRGTDWCGAQRIDGLLCVARRGNRLHRRTFPHDPSVGGRRAVGAGAAPSKRAGVAPSQCSAARRPPNALRRIARARCQRLTGGRELATALGTRARRRRGGDRWAAGRRRSWRSASPRWWRERRRRCRRCRAIRTSGRAGPRRCRRVGSISSRRSASATSKPAASTSTSARSHPAARRA